MSYLRHISTRRLLALCRRASLAIGRRRRGDRARPRAGGADAAAQAARGRRPRRARRPAGRGHHRPDRLHQPPDRLGEPPGRRSAPHRREGPPVGLRRQAAPRAPGLERRRRRGRRAGAARRRPAVGHRPGVEHRLPGHAAAGRRTQSGQQANEPVPSLARIQEALTSLAQHATLSGAQRRQRRRPARLHASAISPRHDGGLLGGAELGVGRRSTASRCAPRSTPAATATRCSSSRRPTSPTARSPPATSPCPSPRARRSSTSARRRPRQHGPAGPAAGHRASTPCRPRCRSSSSRPTTLVGLPRQEVRLVDPAARRARS